MRIPLLEIRKQMRTKNLDPDDILMFAEKNDIAALKKLGDYTSSKY